MSSITGRFWRFATVTLLGIIAVAVALAVLYRYVAVQNFREMRAQQNVELAVALSRTLIDEILVLRDITATRSWAELQSSPEVDRFGSLVDAQLDLLPVYVINIFDTDGLVLYSTERQRIGAKMLMNEGVEMATAGEPVSAIVRRNAFNRFDRMVEDRDMIETYLPLRDESGAVVAVFEIHSDISDYFARIDRTQTIVFIGVGSALSLLYLLLIAYFWRSDRRLFLGLGPRWRNRTGSESETIDRAKSEFVATISHEVRTPLNAVLGMTDLLALTSLTRKQREYIQTIQSSGDMLISLVDNLLDFAHLESGQLELQTSDFDVMDLLERVLRILGHSASSKGLELVLDIRHELDLRVAADKRRIRQILVNVIGNAIKFTDQGEVVVRCDANAALDGRLSLRFEISDTGPGIDDKQRERLFAAFASGIRPASDQRYGSGLGLTITKQLLDSMGGSIDLHSREQGGTVVTIEVPVDAAASSNTEDLAISREGWPRRILALHANHAAAGSMCRLLRKWDMHCEILFDVEEGMHRLRVAASGANPFDCVIVDSALTPNDRLLTVRRIRSSPEVADMPVVLLTSISEPLGIGEVSALGYVRCVNKPVLPLDLRYSLLQSVRTGPDPDRAPQSSEDAATEAGEIRILIAEDNPVSSSVLQSMLRTEGFGADAVDNGPAVLDAMANHHYDLLLLDCQMPGMDGDEVTGEIRDAPERYSGNPVVVAVTADTTEGHRAKCLAAGMDDFMPKPIRLDSLRSGLRHWVEMVTERKAAGRGLAKPRLTRSISERMGNADESFVSDYIGLFLKDTEQRLSAMTNAFTSGDTETVRREGHALKGSCLELGADRMARFCEDLTMAAQHDNLDEVGAVIGKLDREFARLRPVYESAQVISTSPS